MQDPQGPTSFRATLIGMLPWTEENSEELAALFARGGP